MKLCKECNQLKDKTNFYKGKSQCKPCAVKRTQEYSKTPRGLATKIYSNQRQTSRNMNRPMPSYSLDELFDWLLKQPTFYSLYYKWVDSNFDKYLSPSCDRIDNDRPYTLDNIQLVTWKGNLLNKGKHLKQGKLIGKSTTPVNQLDLEGNFIAYYPSVTKAMQALGKFTNSNSNILMVCKGKYKTAYGYKWQFA
mgnify:CR=1 FL=1